jgi:hypothetical protein
LTPFDECRASFAGHAFDREGGRSDERISTAGSPLVLPAAKKATYFGKNKNPTASPPRTTTALCSRSACWAGARWSGWGAAEQGGQPGRDPETINGDSNRPFFRALRAAGVTPEKTPTVSFSIAEPELRAWVSAT